MRLIIRMLSIGGLVLTGLGLYLTISGAINYSHGGGWDAIGGAALGIVLLLSAGLLLVASGLLAAANAVRRGARRWWIGILLTLLGGIVAPGVFDQITHGSPLPTASTYLPYLIGLLAPSLATLGYSFTGGDESGGGGSHRPALTGLSALTLVLLGATALTTLVGDKLFSGTPDATFVLAFIGIALALVVAGTLALMALRHRRFKWFSGLLPVTLLAALLVVLSTPLVSGLNLGPLTQASSGAIAVVLAILVPVATLISSLFSHHWSEAPSS
jgi:hypothetical protein